MNNAVKNLEGRHRPKSKAVQRYGIIIMLDRTKDTPLESFKGTRKLRWQI